MNSSATDPLIGRTIDHRYLIEDRIARGGMAAVYRGLDYRLERPVAVKVMHQHLAEDEHFTQRFIQEARQAARLAHPNIVNVFDQGQDGPITFIVMEYLPGITLRELLRDFTVLNWEQTLDVSKAILQGLDAAHSAGIVHRDLKPENVLMADDGRIKIADFGLARAASHNTQTGQALLGTVAYLSPELVTGAPADVRSDFYALGIMVFEMLTGRQPFTGDQAVTIAYQHANSTVPAPSTVNPDVPAELDELVAWCTQREPDDRPASSKALLEHIRELESRIAKRVASEPKTEAITQQYTKVMSPAKLAEDDLPTEVISREEEVFAGLETPDYSEPEPIKAAVATERRRPGVWMWIVFALAAIAAISTAIWLFAPKAPAIVSVSDVRGLTLDQARTQLTDLGLLVDASTGESFDEEIPVGLVVGTTPEVGTELEEGSPITIVVSLGIEPTSLPALVGLSLDDATASLDEARLILGDVTYVFSDTTEKGQVIEMSSPDGLSLTPNMELDVGITIDLLISAGALPDVSGLSVEEAEALLGDAGLTGVVGGDGDYSDTIAEGLVIDFVRPQGVTLRPGDTVTLTVSRGPELITIPDVVGKTIQDAVDELRALGLTVEVRSEYPETAWDESFARVTSLEPSAGQQVPIGSKVIIRSFV